MIISASRRTDIPALYSDWLLKRLEAGYAMMPNPRNPKRLGRVTLSPAHVDCIVFWTKNPAPMLHKLPSIASMGYAFYFHFTLTPYDRSVESNLPSKTELIETFGNLCRQIGSERIVWRYDPIIIDSKHTQAWHLERFEFLCAALSGYTKRCIVSFIDSYKSLGKIFRPINENEQHVILSGFSIIAARYGLQLFTCAEEIDAAHCNVAHAACIDKGIIEAITGHCIEAKTDNNQRSACKCIESVDIGAYGTCIHGCRYCYATSSESVALRQCKEHDAEAPMITGYPVGDEIITDRTRPSCKNTQCRLF